MNVPTVNALIFEGLRKELEMEDADRSLTLLHLRKTFSEYCKIPLSGIKDSDRRFDRVLPLFSKVLIF